MKKIILIIAGIFLLGIGVVAFIYRDLIPIAYDFYQMMPDKSFDETIPPPAPDYASDSWWAALPGRSDEADVIPNADVIDNQPDASVDVFFIHPTTYFEAGNSWNQPFENETANRRLKLGVMMGQASSFNGCCKIYAPKYRQAALLAFMDGDDGPKALDLAYEDVKSAFEYFIKHLNMGRPFILASHSQGSFHAVRLLEDYFTSKPLLHQLVAAYLIGGPMTNEHLNKTPDIPLCDSPTSTRCQIGWNTVGKEYSASNYADSHCINPLNWRADQGYASSNNNLGGVRFTPDNRQPDIDPAVVDAECQEGKLVISRPPTGYDYMMMGPENYHIYDYSLFYMNIRQNAIDRSLAFLGASGSANP